MRLLTLVSLVGLVSIGMAGEFNKKLNIGDAAPAWKNLPGIDGKNHSLADLKDKEFVVVVFTCNSCACSEEYEDRIVAFDKQFNGRVALVGINVNTIAEDKLDAMKKRATKKGFKFQYLYDESQQIAKDFGAVFTPEVYVLNRERKIVYMGAIDDHSDPKIAKQRYLEEAVEAALAGKEPTEKEIVPIGCRIRYARERRGKS